MICKPSLVVAPERSSGRRLRTVVETAWAIRLRVQFDTSGDVTEECNAP